MTTSPTPRMFSERLYGLLLYVYPVHHRREYGPFMAQVFRDMCRSTRQKQGRKGLVGLWARALADVAVSAPREHLDQLRDSIRTLRRTHKENFAMAITNSSSFAFGHITNIGMVRSRNEDITSVRFFPSSTAVSSSLHHTGIGLLMVLDGLGGHADGAQAAERGRAEIETVVETALDSKPVETHAGDILSDAFRAAHVAIRTDLPDSGVCATCALVMDDHLTLAHAGDVRAYLMAEDTLTQITTDHLQPTDDGQPSVVVTRALGMPARAGMEVESSLEFDVLNRHLTPHTRLLLCSDGLWRVVADDEIRAILTSEHDPKTACERLIALANERGGEDNIAVLVVQMQ